MTNEYFSKFCLKCSARGSDVEAPVIEQDMKTYNSNIYTDKGYHVEQFCQMVMSNDKYDTDILGYFERCPEFDKIVEGHIGESGGYFTGDKKPKSEEIIKELHDKFVPDPKFQAPPKCPYRLEFLLSEDKI